MKVLWLTLLCLGVGTSASAQIFPIQAGTMLEFYHGTENFALTMKYQLCVDAVTDTACKDIAVTPSTTVGWYQFPTPDTIPSGSHFIGVRAVGFGTIGPGAVSNALQVNMNPPPGTFPPPSSFRLKP